MSPFRSHFKHQGLDQCRFHCQQYWQRYCYWYLLLLAVKEVTHRDIKLAKSSALASTARRHASAARQGASIDAVLARANVLAIAQRVRQAWLVMQRHQWATTSGQGLEFTAIWKHARTALALGLSRWVAAARAWSSARIAAQTHARLLAAVTWRRERHAASVHCLLCAAQ